MHVQAPPRRHTFRARRTIASRERLRKVERTGSRRNRSRTGASTVTRTGLEWGHGDPVISLHCGARLLRIARCDLNYCHPAPRDLSRCHAFRALRSNLASVTRLDINYSIEIFIVQHDPPFISLHIM